jgi:hypothetical protein
MSADGRRQRSKYPKSHAKIMDAIEYTTIRDRNDPNALTIKERIAESDRYGMTRNEISNHLGMLKKEGRIKATKDKRPTYSIVPGRRYSRTFAQPVPISPTLNLVGVGMDRNGNKIAQFKPTDSRMGRGFSIQTNGNLPMLHNIPQAARSIGMDFETGRRIRNQIRRHIGMYGTDRQNQLIGQTGDRAIERGRRRVARQNFIPGRIFEQRDV